MPANVEVCCLCKNYDRIRAVDNVSFKAGEGEVIALLGPNGAGKSTLMNMMAGYLAPSAGDIFICGRNIRDFPLEGKQNVGFLPEGSPLYPDLTVRAFLNYMAGLRLLEENENRFMELKAAIEEGIGSGEAVGFDTQEHLKTLKTQRQNG